jgi:class 3 adenylate cyclase/predicted ATPase
VDIAAWLQDLGMERYAEAFRDNEIDGDILGDLTDSDFEKLGIPLGHRKKLLRAIARLSTTGAQPSASSPSGPTQAVAREAERRQLTVMFVDLVGSTELVTRLDPEEMAHVISAYQDCCSKAVGRWGGHIAKYMGDGLLAYFGWPQAHEDEAERAVRAGLAIVDAITRLNTPAGAPLAARVGIATGVVMVGGLIGEGPAQEQTVVGETPNLAARLQALAAPGSVVISQATRRLVGGLFELADLGPRRLKGFAAPLAAWRVAREGRAEGRFEALRGERLTPLVGREHELGILFESWARAKDGDGQVVLLAGEPGIGKSRLIRALRGRLGDEPYTPLSHYCSPYHTNSALYPVIGLLERAARLDRDAPPDEQLGRLEAMLAPSSERADEIVPLLAALLGVPTGARYPSLTLTPELQKRLTFEALLEQLAALAAQRPVLALYEDAHWIDPSTLELLGLVIERIQGLPVLVLITFRPEFQSPWTAHSHVATLTMSRLGRRQGAALVARVAGEKLLPAAIVEQIVARTDGVPLFVEELTKTVLESGLLADAGDHYELSGPLRPLAIPATLHDSLLARLDRLASVKEVAQIGAVIGREFSHELLAAVSPLSEADLGSALDQLITAELIFRRGAPPATTYSFKHALVQDAAYQSLLRSRRQQLHARIARVLEQSFREAVGAEPEVIAQHCTEAGLAERAVRYWWQAAQQATQRSATLESIAHLENGLNLLHTLPDCPEHVRLELDMQVALGTAYMAAKGWSSPVTVAAFARAEELCERVDDPLQRSVADYGRFLVYLLRGQVDAALATSTAMLSRAERDRSVATTMIAHRCVGVTSVHLGDFDSARRHMETALALYDPKEHATLAYRFGYEPRIANLSYLAQALLQLGYRDRALESYDQLMEEIRTHQHTPSVAFGLFQASLFCTFERDLGAYRPERDFGADEAIVDKLIAVCTEHGFSLWRTAGLIYKGWLMARSGEADRGLTQMWEGMAAWRGDAKAMVSRWLLLLASALGRLGQLRASLDAIEEGLALVTETNERWNEAELHLRKGELLLDFAVSDEAEASFQQALAVARHQRARIWELRAATSLARLWAEQGRRTEARDLLAPVYGWFTEGFDTRDLKDAKALLDALG